MKHMISSLRSLPNFLAFLFLFCLAIPLWSLSFVPSPLVLLRTEGIEIAILSTYAYWIGPAVICLSIMLRSAVFLPAFALQILAAEGFALYQFRHGSSGFEIVRMVVLGVLALMILTVGKRDMIFPFLSRHARGWRKVPRVAVNARVYLELGGKEAGEKVVPVLMEDYSQSGFAASGDAGALAPFLSKGAKGRDVKVAIGSGRSGEKATTTARVVWWKDQGATSRIGFSFDDDPNAASFIGAIGGVAAPRGIGAQVGRRLANSRAQQAALGIWVAALATSFGVPACGVDHDSVTNLRSRSKFHQDGGEGSPSVDSGTTAGFGLTGNRAFKSSTAIIASTPWLPNGVGTVQENSAVYSVDYGINAWDPEWELAVTPTFLYMARIPRAIFDSALDATAAAESMSLQQLYTNIRQSVPPLPISLGTSVDTHAAIRNSLGLAQWQTTDSQGNVSNWVSPTCANCHSAAFKTDNGTWIVRIGLFNRPSLQTNLDWTSVRNIVSNTLKNQTWTGLTPEERHVAAAIRTQADATTAEGYAVGPSVFNINDEPQYAPDASASASVHALANAYTLPRNDDPTTHLTDISKWVGYNANDYLGITPFSAAAMSPALRTSILTKHDTRPINTANFALPYGGPTFSSKYPRPHQAVYFAAPDDPNPLFRMVYSCTDTTKTPPVLSKCSARQQAYILMAATRVAMIDVEPHSDAANAQFGTSGEDPRDFITYPDETYLLDLGQRYFQGITTRLPKGFSTGTTKPFSVSQIEAGGTLFNSRCSGCHGSVTTTRTPYQQLFIRYQLPTPTFLPELFPDSQTEHADAIYKAAGYDALMNAQALASLTDPAKKPSMGIRPTGKITPPQLALQNKAVYHDCYPNLRDFLDEGSKLAAHDSYTQYAYAQSNTWDYANGGLTILASCGANASCASTFMNLYSAAQVFKPVYKKACETHVGSSPANNWAANHTSPTNGLAQADKDNLMYLLEAMMFGSTPDVRPPTGETNNYTVILDRKKGIPPEPRYDKSIVIDDSSAANPSAADPIIGYAEVSNTAWLGGSFANPAYGLYGGAKWTTDTGNWAYWTFTGLDPASAYGVYASWTSATNRTSKARYIVASPYCTNNNGTFGQVDTYINQQAAPYPNAYVDGQAFQNIPPNTASGQCVSMYWPYIPDYVPDSTGTIRVWLQGGGSDSLYSIADAVMLVKKERQTQVGSRVIIDDSDAGFKGGGGLTARGYFQYGYKGSQTAYPVVASGAQPAATWTATLGPGTWDILATWAENPNRSPEAQYSRSGWVCTDSSGKVSSASAGANFFPVNQRVLPKPDDVYAGKNFQRLNHDYDVIIVPPGSSCAETIGLSNVDPNAVGSYVIADAVEFKLQ